jgi:8-oxo-dGTP pyrophosphatase MutT (NUDIX family)
MVGAHIESGTPVPVTPRQAATVMLVRGGSPRPGTAAGATAPVEVFMLRRARTMAFAPDAIVFPGGRVDDLDADPDLPWAGPSARRWARRLDCDEATARALAVAAARELFEETGVLLAAPDETGELPGPLPQAWAEDRSRLARHEESLAAVLARRELVLRADWLGLRSRWLTPEFEPRRYDTFFFAALAPKGQSPDADTLEAAGGGWMRPEQVIADADGDKILLLAPTAYNLAHLASAASAEAFVAERPTVRRIMMAPKTKPDGEIVLACVLP